MWLRSLFEPLACESALTRDVNVTRVVCPYELRRRYRIRFNAGDRNRPASRHSELVL